MTKPPPEDDALTPGPRQELLRDTLIPTAPTPKAETPPDSEGTKWTYSSTRKLAQWILGQKGVLPAFVRVTHRKGQPVQIVMQKGANRIVLGSGQTFQQAFENTFLAPLKAKEEALAAAIAEEPTLAGDKSPREDATGTPRKSSEAEPRPSDTMATAHEVTANPPSTDCTPVPEE